MMTKSATLAGGSADFDRPAAATELEYAPAPGLAPDREVKPEPALERLGASLEHLTGCYGRLVVRRQREVAL